MHTIVLNPANSAGVGCNAPANLALGASADIYGEGRTSIKQILFDVKHNCTCFDADNALVFIEKKYLLQESKVYDHFVVHGYRAPNKASVSTLRHHGDFSTVAVF